MDKARAGTYLGIVEANPNERKIMYTVKKLNAMVELANELCPLEEAAYAIARRGSDCYPGATTQVVIKHFGGGISDLTAWGTPATASIEFYNQLKFVCSDPDKLAELSALTA